MVKCCIQLFCETVTLGRRDTFQRKILTIKWNQTDIKESSDATCECVCVCVCVCARVCDADGVGRWMIQEAQGWTGVSRTCQVLHF